MEPRKLLREAETIPLNETSSIDITWTCYFANAISCLFALSTCYLYQNSTTSKIVISTDTRLNVNGTELKMEEDL